MYSQDKVRLIAYSIWEDEGRPDGRDVEHWCKAESTWQEKQGQMKQVAKAAPSPTHVTAKRGGVSKQSVRRSKRAKG